MKIDVRNSTQYRDDDLRKLVREAFKHTGVRCAKLLLMVRPQRANGRVNGRASCVRGKRSHWIRAHVTLYIRKPDSLDLDRLKKTVIHEAMHLCGATHATMTEEQRYCTFELPDWARPLELRVKEAPVIDVAAERTIKIERVRKRHKQALTRLRLATTIEKKWRRRLARLEREGQS